MLHFYQRKKDQMRTSYMWVNLIFQVSKYCGWARIILVCLRYSTQIERAIRTLRTYFELVAAKNLPKYSKMWIRKKHQQSTQIPSHAYLVTTTCLTGLNNSAIFTPQLYSSFPGHHGLSKTFCFIKFGLRQNLSKFIYIYIYFGSTI